MRKKKRVIFTGEETRESIDLKSYSNEGIDLARQPQGTWFAIKEDNVVLDKFPDALSIVPLEKERKKSPFQHFMDWFCCCFTDFPDSGADLINLMECRGQHYLVELEEKWLLVKITRKECVSRPLSADFVSNEMKIGNDYFRQTGRKVLAPKQE